MALRKVAGGEFSNRTFVQGTRSARAPLRRHRAIVTPRFSADEDCSALRKWPISPPRCVAAPSGVNGNQGSFRSTASSDRQAASGQEPSCGAAASRFARRDGEVGALGPFIPFSSGARSQATETKAAVHASRSIFAAVVGSSADQAAICAKFQISGLIPIAAFEANSSKCPELTGSYWHIVMKSARYRSAPRRKAKQLRCPAPTAADGEWPRSVSEYR